MTELLDNTEIKPNENVVVIPNKIDYKAIYKANGYAVENGIFGLPSPLNVLTGVELIAVKKATLAYQYQQKIKETLVYNGWPILMSDEFQNSMDKRVLMVERGQWVDTTDGFIDGAGEHHIITGEQVTEISLLMINHVRSCTTWYQQQLQDL